MEAHYEIEQGSEEWFKIKHRKIGGTLSKGLFVKSDTLLIDILSQDSEPFEMDYDSYASADMQRGNELEPLGRSELSKYIGIELIQAGWLQSLTNPRLGISPDGISKCETVSAEIKCPAAKKHTETILNDTIPSDHIHQCLHYFTVNPKLEKHYFCSFRPENIYKPLFVKELTRDSLIDLGFTVKGKIKEDRGLGVKEYVSTEPDLKTVQQWVEIAKAAEVELEKQIAEKVKQLEF